MGDTNDTDKVELVQLPDNIESDSEPMEEVPPDEEEAALQDKEEEEEETSSTSGNKPATKELSNEEEEALLAENNGNDEDEGSDIELIEPDPSKKKEEVIIDLDSENESTPNNNKDDDEDDEGVDNQNTSTTTKVNNGVPLKNMTTTTPKTTSSSVVINQEEEDILEVPESDPFGDCNDSKNDMDVEDDDDDDSQLAEDGDSISKVTPKSLHSSNVGDDSTSFDDSKSPALLDLSNKKDPSSNLVIIDTNAILSGKGLVPIDKSRATSTTTPSLSTTHLNNMKFDFDPRPGNIGTFGDIKIGAPKYSTVSSANLRIPDDAYLIEAPSFIVPYVFEQTGEKSLKDTIRELEETIRKNKELKIQKGEKLDEDDEIREHKKSTSEDYFESPVGRLLINVGMNLVQEYVQVDLLKMQKRKAEKEKEKSRNKTMSMQTQQSIISLKKNIEESKENNEPFRHETKKCTLCNFKTESSLVMSAHLETPHMRNYSYRCNFCEYTTRVPQEILFHMEAEHFVMPRLERAPAYHQCPNCAFEDNSKAKLTRHLIGCTKRFKIEKNLEPPIDWDTPAKLPKLSKSRILPQGSMSSYMQHASQQQRNQAASYINIAPKFIPGSGINAGKMSMPPLLQAPKSKPVPGLIRTNPKLAHPNQMSPHLQRGMMMRAGNGNAGQLGLSQSHLQLAANNQMLQQMGGNMSVTGATSAQVGGFLSKLGLLPSAMGGPNASAAQKSALASHSMRNPKPSTQPSISITPLPRQTGSSPAASSNQPKQPQGGAGKTSFVICEICDGYIKDLDQLRNHMQWIHKVKIHPKMIYNKPPLNCQKCQFRFFTDQGLERHLLGSHGLVTSSMQDSANKGQDSGRCPLCGKVYQWKLLAHVAKDHNVTLKPAHLSYKCTVCTATFGMYKLFESHVYSAHSMGSKRNDRRPALPNNNNNSSNNINSNSANRASQMQVTSRPMSAATSQNSFKPMKINDEITIIPQVLANSHLAQRNKGSLTITPQGSTSRRNLMSNEDDGIQIIEIDDAPSKPSANGRNLSNPRENGDFKGRLPISDSTLRKRNLEISVCGTDSDNNSSDESFNNRGPPQKRLRSSNITIN